MSYGWEGDGPVAPLRWQFDSEVVDRMFAVSSSFHCSPLDFVEFTADALFSQMDCELLSAPADVGGREETHCDGGGEHILYSGSL